MKTETPRGRVFFGPRNSVVWEGIEFGSGITYDMICEMGDLLLKMHKKAAKKQARKLGCKIAGLR